MVQMVREFLERYFTIENEINVLQQDKSALCYEFKGRGLDMKTMAAAIAIAQKRQHARRYRNQVASMTWHALPENTPTPDGLVTPASS
jgi:uncharacterized protein (UPF0335 family)